MTLTEYMIDIAAITATVFACITLDVSTGLVAAMTWLARFILMIVEEN